MGSLVQAAFLILQAAAAWTGIISADLGTATDMSSVMSLNVSSFFGRGLLFKREFLQAPLGGHFFDEWLAPGEKTFISRTQVIQSRFTIWRPDKAILRTLAITHRPDFTLQAITGERIQFGLAECSLRRTLENLDQWRLLYISEPVFAIDEVVT
jgi:hypothetical protein